MICFISALVLCLLLIVEPACGEGPEAKKALVIGIDGCRADAIDYSQAKYLKQLIREGAFTDTTDVLGDRKSDALTVTGPGWSTVFTGVFADKHRVKDNSFKDHALAKFPNFLRRYEKLKPNGRTLALLTWKPFSDQLFQGTQGAKFLVDGDTKGYEQADKEVAQAAKKALAQGNLDVVFAYFGNVDMLGHGYGFHPKSYKYTNGIETVDAYIGGMLEAIRQRKTYNQEDWLILVCTDHGGRGRGHALGRDVPEIRYGFLILHGPSVVAGRIEPPTTNADVAATVLTHLQVKLDPQWQLDGKPVALKK